MYINSRSKMVIDVAHQRSSPRSGSKLDVPPDTARRIEKASDANTSGDSKPGLTNSQIFHEKVSILETLYY